jgi:cysteine desulfurase
MARRAGIYLDNNASTMLLPEVAEFMADLLRRPIANASSPHSLGAEAKKILETGRLHIADAVGANSEQVFLVSSGSEANTMALAAALHQQPRRDTVVTTTVEHSSIHKAAEDLGARGVEVVEVGVGADGIVDMDQLRAAVSPRTALVSVQWVNNETGVVQPVEEIRGIAREEGALFHCDAAQGFGKLRLDMDATGFDLVTVTAHKINGPQGCAALCARSAKLLRPVIAGGGQERGLRGGTENVLCAAGFGEAARLRMARFDGAVARMRECRDRFEGILVGGRHGVTTNGSRVNRVCNTTNLLFSGVDGRMLVAHLDELGVYCSQSSACTSQTPRPSYVLRAMGLSESDAYASVRFSFGVTNTIAEAEEAARIVAEVYVKALQMVKQFA